MKSVELTIIEGPYGNLYVGGSTGAERTQLKAAGFRPGQKVTVTAASQPPEPTPPFTWWIGERYRFGSVRVLARGSAAAREEAARQLGFDASEVSVTGLDGVDR